MVDDARRRFLRGRSSPSPTVLVDDACLNRRGVECRLCADVCETRALRFMPSPGGIAKLVVDNARCSGCGDCLPLCPASAIVLR